jgi:cytochrome c oxidase cbb3-type subunit 3
MPRFDFSDQQIANLTAFIHAQQDAALTQKGGRRGVDVSDLQTGKAEAGKRYFDGAGGCVSCHSPTGDLAGIASRYRGLELEEQMLYPKHAKSSVTVRLASGETITGSLEYLDEFTVGLIDPAGWYRSWRTGDVEYKVDAPVNAHAELLSRYTDVDIHDLMAYLQTLR